LTNFYIEKLEQVSFEKKALQDEHENNHVQIQDYTQKINDLKVIKQYFRVN